jgi:tellurite resistance protein
MDVILKKKINMLIHLAGVDGHFDESERAFIYNICLRHGVDLDLIGYLIAEPEPIEDIDKLPHETAVDYLTESILLMMVDGKVLPTEVKFCIDIGVRLGFKREDVSELIESTRGDLGISYDELESLIKKLDFKE